MLGTTLAQPPGPPSQWERVLRLNGYYGGSDLERLPSGSLYLSGFLWTGGDSDFFLTKLNSQGDSLWTRTFGDPDHDDAMGTACAAPNGDLLVAGYTVPTPDPFIALPAVVRVDTQGSVVWMRTYERFQSCYFYRIIPVHEGGYILCGQADEPYWYGGAVLRMAENGDTLWWRYYDYPTYHSLGIDAILETMDGGFVFGGGDVQFPMIGRGQWLIKVNASGETEFERWYPYGTGGVVADIAALSDGGFLLLGNFIAPDSIDAMQGIRLIRTNDQGDTLWTRLAVSHELRASPGRMVLLEDGDFAFSGSVRIGSQALTLLDRWDENGNLIWRSLYSTYVDPVFSGLMTNGRDRFWLGGAGPDIDACAVIATEADTLGYNSVGEWNGALPQALQLQAYPNPFNSTTRIILNLRGKGLLKLKLYDILGREVRVLYDGPAIMNRLDIALDGSTLASGSYWIVAQMPNERRILPIKLVR